MQNKDNNNSDTVSIRPGVQVLSVFPSLNYKPWFALAEFVDNAIQSFIDQRDALEKLHGADCKVKVWITIEPKTDKPGKITILDNAGGITQKDFPRAFKLAEGPANTQGLSEFGMGMKSASCWFSPKWHVRTKALGEEFERTVKFDVNQIVSDQIDTLSITQKPFEINEHFTEVILESPHHLPQGRTIGKIKEHLTDIYRMYVRKGMLELYYDGELLKYLEPEILVTPYVRDNGSEPKRWRKDFNFDFGQGLSVKGFAALRERGKTAQGGFALFRRDRLIQGSGDEGYRPNQIFIQPNSFRSQRLFGELHLEGFKVSHTKDGIRWDENEEPFLERLKEHLDSDTLPLLRQADEYRVRATKEDLKKIGEKALDGTVKAIENILPEALSKLADKPPVDTPSTPLSDQTLLASREFAIDYENKNWIIKVELADDDSEDEDWLQVSNQVSNHLAEEDTNVIEIRVMQSHPFMVNFAQADKTTLEAVLRIAAGLALSEILAIVSGVEDTGTIRRNLNDILSKSLSQL